MDRRDIDESGTTKEAKRAVKLIIYVSLLGGGLTLTLYLCDLLQFS